LVHSSSASRFLLQIASALTAVLAVTFVLSPRDVGEAQSGFVCTQIMGYSQMGNTAYGGWGPYAAEVMVGTGPDTVQLRWQNGGAAFRWADPSYPGWGTGADPSGMPQSPCAQSAPSPDRVILDITHNEYLTAARTNGDPVGFMVRNINGFIAQARAHYPNLRSIVLQPVVGGPNHTTCPWSGAEQGVVRASYNHPYIHQAIQRVVGGNVTMGYDSQVRTCADYNDDVGHLNPRASEPIGTAIGTFYRNGGALPPPATATPARTSTPVPSATPTPRPATPIPATATPGVQAQSSNRSVHFGGGAYADTPNAGELDPTGSWTVEVWFRDQDPQGYGHSRARLITKGDPYVEANVPYALSIGGTALEIVMRANGQYVVLTTPLTGIQPNTWHHAAAVFDASTRELELFLDGAKVARGTSPVGVQNNTGAFVVGGSPSASCCSWNGELDDVRVWNVARTAQQIRGSYRTEIEALGTAGLVGNWRFNEGTGQTASDTGGAPQNLTLHGVTWTTDVHQ